MFVHHSVESLSIIIYSLLYLLLPPKPPFPSGHHHPVACIFEDFFFFRNLFVTEQKLFFRCLQPPTGNFPRQRLVEKKRGPYSKIPQFRKTGHSPALGSSLPQQKSPSGPPKTNTVPRNPTPLEREAAKWMALRLQAPSQGLHVGLAQKLPCSFQDLVNPTNALAHTLCQRIRKENVHISPFSLFQSFGSNFLAH